ncbi:MAG: PLP-dependent transferase [Clostridiaceae bacterium]|nr:PLP-dependent transferase [Clostridiaceae bacterium]
MMPTPIWNYVRLYKESQALRFHMPGHKGIPFLGAEPFDITEIVGADSLYEANGIIKESEKNAGTLFGAETFYSTEGSSLCIRAMLYLTVLYAKQSGRKPLIAAGRNAHKAFLTAAAMLDFKILWLHPEQKSSYLSCRIHPAELEKNLKESAPRPTAVYLTSPDYLGNTVDIYALAEVCHKYGVLLLVDNAHGAYLKFLPQSLHPIDLGADMCCDSAHKTLPVLTGGAYLHISPAAPRLFAEQAKNAMALFGSTSPSYLILQSLDRANQYLSEGYPAKLKTFMSDMAGLKARLMQQGFSLLGDEPLKLTIEAKKYGYTGKQLAAILLEKNIVCEFSDPDDLVLMTTPETGTDNLKSLEAALLSIPQKDEINEKKPRLSIPVRVLSVREASLSNRETVPTESCAGRILASVHIACPPAVPIVVCGERIDDNAVQCLRYYGIASCDVVAD